MSNSNLFINQNNKNFPYSESSSTSSTSSSSNTPFITNNNNNSNKPKYNLQNIPPQKLLHYITKSQLISNISSQYYQELQNKALENNEKFSVKLFKQMLSSNSNFIKKIKNSDIGRQAYQKYVKTYLRMTNPKIREKASFARKYMSTPKKGFYGCISTKVNPNDFKDCVDNYYNDEYQSISSYPSKALRQSVYNRTNNELIKLPKNTHISYLPKGLKNYIRNHPDDYKAYIEERKSEIRYLKSLKKSSKRNLNQLENPNQSSTFSKKQKNLNFN